MHGFFTHFFSFYYMFAKFPYFGLYGSAYGEIHATAFPL